jgi:DNA invertase Pin-like site-specific DNA recombinase
MMRVAIYSRVSTSDQDLSNQEIRLEEFCKMREWEIVKSYNDVISGLKDKRPGLDKLLQDARKRKFDVVVSVKLDRLGRSTKHLLLFVAELKHFRVDICFTDQAIDTTGPMGMLIFTVLGAVAEFERSLIVERTKAGQDRARKQGKKIGRPSKDLSKETIQRILGYRKDGLSYSQLSEKFGISRAFLFKLCNSTVHKEGAIKKSVSQVETEPVHKPVVLKTEGVGK